jgi:MOSC domain-containing protein YiiM
MARIIAVSTSAKGGIPKLPAPSAEFVAGSGLVGDVHFGNGDRQVSLLELEVLEALKADAMEVGPGILGENVTTEGIEMAQVGPGDRLHLGGEVILEIAKERTPCRTLSPVDRRLPRAIIGRCGLLARVVRGGAARAGEPIVHERASTPSGG